MISRLISEASKEVRHKCVIPCLNKKTVEGIEGRVDPQSKGFSATVKYLLYAIINTVSML